LLEDPVVRTLNIQETKTHLPRLVDQAAKGEPFTIAGDGKPLVNVVPWNAPEAGGWAWKQATVDYA
jgi:antitoxin (DNA-binding transcriptional repressor) of toxin-antitoxin stability system